MTEGGCIGEFPHNVIGDELLPLRVVVDKCLDMLLQESARDCHLSFLVHFLVGVKSGNRFYRSARERSSQNYIPSRQNDSVARSVFLWERRFGVIDVNRWDEKPVSGRDASGIAPAMYFRRGQEEKCQEERNKALHFFEEA